MTAEKKPFLSAFQEWSSRVGRKPQESEGLVMQSESSTKFEEIATPFEMHDILFGGSTRLLANSDRVKKA